MASSSRPMVGDDVVAGPEDPFERHRALQEAVERVLRREADAREHLLAVRRRRVRAVRPAIAFASAAVSGFGSSHAAASAASSVSTATSASASRWRTAWKLRDRATELHPFERVRHARGRASCGTRPRSGARPRGARPRPPAAHAVASMRRRQVRRCARRARRGTRPSGSMPRTGTTLIAVDRHGDGTERRRRRRTRRRAPWPSSRAQWPARAHGRRRRRCAPAATTPRTRGSRTARSTRGSNPSADVITSSSTVAVGVRRTERGEHDVDRVTRLGARASRAIRAPRARRRPSVLRGIAGALERVAHRRLEQRPLGRRPSRRRSPRSRSRRAMMLRCTSAVPP